MSCLVLGRVDPPGAGPQMGISQRFYGLRGLADQCIPQRAVNGAAAAGVLGADRQGRCGMAQDDLLGQGTMIN